MKNRDRNYRQKVLQSYQNLSSVILLQKSQIDPWNRKQGPETDRNVDGNLVLHLVCGNGTGTFGITFGITNL